MNIYIEQIVLKGNKSLHSSIEDNIDDECRKNLLIQKHILPQLPLKAQTGYYRDKYLQKTCCDAYDVRKLELEDVSYFTSDFVAKFCEIHNKELHSLKLKNVHTDHKLGHLMGFLRAERQPLWLQTLHIENSPILKVYMGEIIRSLAGNTKLKHLALVNQMNMQKHLRLLYRSLRDNTTLEHLSLANNEIYEYKHIRKLIQKNHVLRTIDVRGNYMNEEILMEFWESLHMNIELTDLEYDSQDKVLCEKVEESIKMELEMNHYIQSNIAVHIQRRKQNSGEYDLSGLHFDNPAALIKYLNHCNDTLKQESLKVNLSNSDVDKCVLVELTNELSLRELII